jgi:hypothetical protein
MPCHFNCTDPALQYFFPLRFDYKKQENMPNSILVESDQQAINETIFHCLFLIRCGLIILPHFNTAPSAVPTILLCQRLLASNPGLLFYLFQEAFRSPRPSRGGRPSDGRHLPAIFLKFSRSGSPRLKQMAPSYLMTDIYTLCV